MFRTKAIVAVLSTFTLIIVGYFGLSKIDAKEKQSGLLKPNNTELVQLGSEVYAQNCASCHGVDLEGQTPDWRSPGTDGKLPAPPHDETGHTWHHADALLFQITKVGIATAANLKNYESAMPAYEGVLTDEEIIAVLSFIKSTWPADLRAQHDQLNAQFEQRGK